MVFAQTLVNCIWHYDIISGAFRNSILEAVYEGQYFISYVFMVLIFFVRHYFHKSDTSYEFLYLFLSYFF